MQILIAKQNICIRKKNCPCCTLQSPYFISKNKFQNQNPSIKKFSIHFWSTDYWNYSNFTVASIEIGKTINQQIRKPNKSTILRLQYQP